MEQGGTDGQEGAGWRQGQDRNEAKQGNVKREEGRDGRIDGWLSVWNERRKEGRKDRCLSGWLDQQDRVRRGIELAWFSTCWC